MNRANPWKSYHHVATQTASPGQLVLMLFDGALRFLEQARSGFMEPDPALMNQTVNNNVQRAQAIIGELNCSLNMREGGELALTLRRLYDYFDRRLLEANVKKDLAGIQEIAGRITVLRDAWKNMLNQNSAMNAAAREPAPLCALG